MVGPGKGNGMMRRYLLCAMLGASAAACAAGCGRRGETAKDGEVVAVVNGAVIRRSEVDRLTDAFMKQFGSGISAERLASIRAAIGKQALDSLVNQRLLVQEADRQGIVVDPAGIDAQMARVRQMFPDPARLKEQLGAMGVTEEDLRRDIAQNLKIRELHSRQLPEASEPTAKEIEEFYNANPKAFDKSEQVRASHILLTASPNETAEKKAEKRAALAALRERIVKGEDFAKVARENSECPSRASGGDLGFFEKGKMAPEFEKAAFALKKGRLSDIVETPFGYHLIKMTDRKPAEKSTLQKATPQIKSYLVQQKRGKAIQEHLAGLRAAAKIEYPSPEFRPAPPQEAPAAAGGAPAPPRSIKLAPPSGKPAQPDPAPAGPVPGKAGE